ncbi:hypothetical protein ACFFX0_20820 [Citricoccus parietis]|uniref:Uncharacterized protein n=1 Tax=Citricoccus parietis TaxID=592307 RepID=A0ABV5G4D6_9MICC
MSSLRAVGLQRHFRMVSPLSARERRGTACPTVRAGMSVGWRGCRPAAASCSRRPVL